MASKRPNPSSNRRAWSPRLAATVAVGRLAAPALPTGTSALFGGPARLLGLQRPDRGRHRVEGEGLRQLPGAGPGDGLPRRHAGGADRRGRRSSSAGCAGATSRHYLLNNVLTYAHLPAGRRHRLPLRRSTSAGITAVRRRPSTCCVFAALPARPGDQLHDDRRLRLLRGAQLLRRARSARCCSRCCPPSSRAR